VINNYSLVYVWKGSDPKLAPVMFAAHMDVVPIEESTLPAWKVEPFSGTIREGYIWGRGAIDMKSQVTGILESAEALIRSGYTPKRTIYLAFGHDEEIMGFNGAQKINAYFKSKDIHLAAILDEGGLIPLNTLPGVEEPYAMIGVSEKGYMTLMLTAAGKPGHSSQPARQTTIGILARAIALLDDHPLPATLDHFLPTLENIAYLLPFGMQFAIANAWLLNGLLIKNLQKSPTMNAMLRTTHAATIFEGGIKDNVLPALATAKINFRLMPGDTMSSVIDYVKKVIGDPRVDIKVDTSNGGWEASKVAPVDTPAYRSLELVTRQIFDNVAVTPFVFPAATDSHHYQDICDSIFKFSPFALTPDEQQGMHGINERIKQKTFVTMIAFYTRMMRVWGDAEF
jgi:carboxypeptidase PM20D1